MSAEPAPPAPVGGPAPVPPAPRARLARKLVAALAALALLLAVLFFVRTWILVPFLVPTSSMEPALRGEDRDHPGDTIIVNRLAYLLAEPARWEVVAFRPVEADMGAGAATDREGSASIVKRVVGLPGETVEIVDGWVRIDGIPPPRPASLAGVRYTSAGRWGHGPVKLGAGDYFLLGDNSYLSRDSRRFGPVPRANIFGRVEWIVLPWSRRGGVN